LLKERKKAPYMSSREEYARERPMMPMVTQAWSFGINELTI